MRLDKYIAMQGMGTRKEVRALLHAGRVGVDGKAITDAGFALDPEAMQVTLDGAPLQYQAALHITLNKPAGVITAADDPRHETVMDILPKRFASMGCMPVGRLDIDTEGLLLLTTDGQLAHRLLSPKRHVDKVYYAQVDAPLDDADAAAFAAGLELSDFTALPAQLDILPDGMAAHVTVQEGKFHQVKRMFHARGKTVTYLKRIAFGGIALDPALETGAWRELTAEELAHLQQITGGNAHG